MVKTSNTFKLIRKCYGCPCCKLKEEQIVWLKDHLNHESIEIKLDTVVYLNKTIDEAFENKT